MKKIFRILCLIAIFMSFFGCATTSENIQPEEKLRFDDWKYMGFGQDIPYWIEDAIKGDSEKLKNSVPELSDVTAVEIVCCYGSSLDLAEQGAKDFVNEMIAQKEELILFDNFWVREYIEENTDTPYISVYVYFKE